MAARAELADGKRAEIRAALDRVRAIADHAPEPGSDGGRELKRIASWVLERWGEKDRALLKTKSDE